MQFLKWLFRDPNEEREIETTTRIGRDVSLNACRQLGAMAESSSRFDLSMALIHAQAVKNFMAENGETVRQLSEGYYAQVENGFISVRPIRRND